MEKIVKLAVFKGSFVVKRLGKEELVKPSDGFLDYYESEANYLKNLLNIKDPEVAKIAEADTKTQDVLVEKDKEIEVLKAQLEALKVNSPVASEPKKGRPAKVKNEEESVEAQVENQELVATQEA